MEGQSHLQRTPDSLRQANLKVYLIFAVGFLVLHYSGVFAADMRYIYNALITAGSVITILLMLVSWGSKRTLADTIRVLGMHGTAIKNLQPGIVLSAILLLVYPIIGWILGTDIRLADDWLFNLAGLLLTGGLTEELLFRGYLFGTLRRRWTFGKAALVSAVFFTLAHLLLFAYLDWPIALMSTVLAITGSVPFAYLYEKGNNTIWSPALVHATIRTVGMVVIVGEEQYMTFSLLWIAACMVLPYVVLVCYKDFRDIWKKQSFHGIVENRPL